MWRVLYVAFITITVHIYYITDYISPERARSSSDTCHFCEKVTFVLVFRPRYKIFVLIPLLNTLARLSSGVQLSSIFARSLSLVESAFISLVSQHWFTLPLRSIRTCVIKIETIKGDNLM